MHSLHIIMHIATAAASFAGMASAANSSYTLEDDYNISNFFQSFTFFTAADPTAGLVSYQSSSAANASGLAGFSEGAVMLGVDHKTVNPKGGRASVRVTSKKQYNHGLFIADIAHMPGGICGVWPAFWTVGPNWPADGEIDIIEGVNDYATDAITLHTSAGCNLNSSGSLTSSKLSTSNCNANTAFDGCSFSTASTQGFGTGFNANQGGVYAMQWSSTGISVWFFTRALIPADITSGKPNPTSWGTPSANFAGSGCDIDNHFQNHQIVFDTTFCGQWAGNAWIESSTCAAKAATCDDYVNANPEAFTQAYWLINSVKVYQEAGSKKRGALASRFAA